MTLEDPPDSTAQNVYGPFCLCAVLVACFQLIASAGMQSFGHGNK